MNMWIITALVLSGMLNVLLIWYVAKILGKLIYVSENMGDLYVMFRFYNDFIETLYGMEMFYGEPIIEELMARTKVVIEAVEEFESIYDLTVDVDEVDIAIEELENDAEEEN